MRYLILTMTIVFSTICQGKTVKIAVIDTGFDFKKSKSVKLCKSGHKDFTGTGIHDLNGHGTNVAGLIAKGNVNVDYCLVIVKGLGGIFPFASSIAALRYVKHLDVDMINLSYGGLSTSVEERRHIKDILGKGIKVVAAAGNEDIDLNKECSYFPACYDKRIIVVGNYGTNTNYGNKHVDVVINGNKKRALGITLSGTSQSTAVYTGMLLKKRKTSNYIYPRPYKRDAREGLAKALYIEAGADQTLKKIEDKYISKNFKKYGGLLSATIKILKDRKVQHKWSF